MAHAFSFPASPCRYLVPAAILLITACGAPQAMAQDTPLVSGGVGFLTDTNGGNTTYFPVVSPVLAAPLGSHILVESRADIVESFSPKGGGRTGYTSSSFLGLSYLQGDFLVSPHLTVTAGEFLIPFATYNERLGPIWIGNFEQSPLSFPLGTMNTSMAVGGMVRGSAVSTAKYAVDYAAYFSAASNHQQFNSERSGGGRGNIFFPSTGLELGASYGRLLQNTHQNYAGFHVWYTPPDNPFKLRSEFAHGPHSAGYWIETDYRLSRWGGSDSPVGRLEPLFRMQQTFRNSPDPSDGLPAADTRQADFGLDYHLPHEVRIQSSYSRRFTSSGDRNIWTTGIVYRFLFPTWKGK